MKPIIFNGLIRLSCSSKLNNGSYEGEPKYKKSKANNSLVQAYLLHSMEEQVRILVYTPPTVKDVLQSKLYILMMITLLVSMSYTKMLTISDKGSYLSFNITKNWGVTGCRYFVAQDICRNGAPLTYWQALILTLSLFAQKLWASNLFHHWLRYILHCFVMRGVV